MQKTWTEFKSLIDAGNSFTYYQQLDRYRLYMASGALALESLVVPDRDGVNEVLDFETNYKAKAKLILPSTGAALPDPDGHRFRGERCFIGECAAGVATTFDFDIVEERYLTGFMYAVENENWGDYITFSVVHPVAGVLETFVSSWGVCHGSHLIEVYKAKVPAGLKLRCVYTNVGVNVAKFMANGFLHKRG